MQTDDFLADLERQLSSARPRRRPPAALLAVPLAAVVVALGTLVTGGDRTESEIASPRPTEPVDVLVLNGAANRRAGTGAVASLRANGYPARAGSRVDEGPRSQVDYSGDHVNEAQAIAALLGIERVVRVYGTGLPDVIVSLGNDAFGRSVVVLDASGDPGADARASAALARAGLWVEGEPSRGPLEPRSHIEVFSRHLERGAAVAAALGLEDVPIERITGADPVAAVAVTLGEDFAG